MRVLLVTSDREECGIREYGRLLIEAMGRVEHGVEVGEWLIPKAPSVLSLDVALFRSQWDLVHLNHHAALHASWGAEQVAHLQRYFGVPVVVTQHDTFEAFAIMQERGMPDFRQADALVVHEPVEGLTDVEVAKKHNVQVFGGRADLDFTKRPLAYLLRHPIPPLAQLRSRPVERSAVGRYTVGSVGFPFPWKNYPTLVRSAREAGWRCVIAAPGITADQAEELRQLHPEGLELVPKYLSMGSLVTYLHESCDAMAFLYGTGNSGASGAIRVGLATRRPVVATPSRQFRGLEQRRAIAWLDKGDLTAWLKMFEALPAATVEEWEGRVQAVAEEESWDQGARFYAGLYRGALERRRERA